MTTGRDKHGVAEETGSDPPQAASPKEAMRSKLRTAAGRAVYKMRKTIIEPVFGPIKEQRGFRRFRLRGKENIRREGKLVCAASKQGIQLEVIKHPEAKRDFVLLPRRWVVERSFAWTARFHRMARDDERLATTLAGFHYFAFAWLMLANLFKILNPSS